MWFLFVYFYKLIISFLQVIATRAQSTQKNKFVISLQHLEKEGRDEIYFLYANKHQTTLQVDTINLGGHGQACPNTLNNKSAKSFQYLKKEVRGEGFFCPDEHHSYW